MANELTIYQSVIDDVKDIISSGMESAYNATSRAMVLTYWNVGRRIVEQEQNGNQRAEYGTAMMDALAKELTKEYGKSYSKRNLQYFRKFYQCFPDFEIVNSCVHNLTWTHFRSLLRVPDEDARDNPTIGILLCSETDEDIARYSVLHDNDRLFMSKYLTYLPTKEQLKREIERQKAVFYMQHPLQIEEGGDTE